MKKVISLMLALAMVVATFTVFASQHTRYRTVVGAAISDKDLSTLVTALKKAGLVKTLQGRGKFTVFAPTNRAFRKLGVTLDEILKPQNRRQLRRILLYHVVKGNFTSNRIRPGRIRTMQGSSIFVTDKRGRIMLNNRAKVKEPDIIAGNGVIHVINRVIMPGQAGQSRR